MATTQGTQRGLRIGLLLRRHLYLLIGALLIAGAPLLVVPLYVFGWLDFNSNHLSIGDVIALVLSALLALGLALISIHFSGITITDFYNFRKTGIIRADSEFGLRQWNKDMFFAELIRGAKREIVLCGSSLSGWFRNDDHLSEFIARLAEGVPVTMLFLNPRSTNFRDRERSEGETADHRLGERLTSKYLEKRNRFVLEDRVVDLNWSPPEEYVPIPSGTLRRVVRYILKGAPILDGLFRWPYVLASSYVSDGKKLVFWDVYAGTAPYRARSSV